jgi:hypothetical protein
MNDAIKKKIGEEYVVTHGGVVTALSIWGKGVDYDHRMTIYGDTFEKLITEAQRMIEGGHYSTSDIDKTLKNIDEAEKLLDLARELKNKIEAALPSLHYLRGVRPYEQLYNIHCVYVTPVLE